jgi:hypothetical protein
VVRGRLGLFAPEFLELLVTRHRCAQAEQALRR